ncbi:MAG: hypothetical protein GQ529_03750 [Methyloprofundus sp.]|nr:hypothetical protein [Methyloprofundus sp.]
MLKNIRLICLISLIIIFIVNIYYLFLDREMYIYFLEKYITSDGNIISPRIAFINIQLMFLSSIIVIFLSKYIFINFVSFNDLEKIDKIVIQIIVLLTVSYYLDYALGDKYTLHNEDGLFESLTALLALLASLFFIISIKNVEGYYGKYILLTLSVFSFLFGMEEISWGQRIFNWETPEELIELSYQDETNIHNLFNPIFPILMIFFNSIVCIFMINIENINNIIKKYINNKDIIYIMPGKESQYYAFIFYILIIQSPYYSGELTEEILSLVLFSYAIKQLFIRKNVTSEMTTQ